MTPLAYVDLLAIHAEETVQRQAGLPSERIPLRDVCRRDRHGRHAAVADEMQLAVETVPVRTYVAAVRAEQERADLVLEHCVHRGTAAADRIREPRAAHPVVGLELERHELEIRDLVAARADAAPRPTPRAERDSARC